MTIDVPCLARRLSNGLGAATEAGRVGTRRGWYARKKEVIQWKIPVEVMPRWRSRSDPQCFMRRETSLRGTPTPPKQTV